MTHHSRNSDFVTRGFFFFVESLQMKTSQSDNPKKKGVPGCFLSEDTEKQVVIEKVLP